MNGHMLDPLIDREIQSRRSPRGRAKKLFALTFALCACLAAADVSHLQPGSSYLPPPRPEPAISMSIEQQELRELPEQVEYMRMNKQGQMEAMPASLLTPPAPESEMEAMPSTRYLPPSAPVPSQMNVEPMEMMAPEQPAMEQLQAQPQLAMRYLPPAPQENQQLTYQQYQEQMEQLQMQQLQEQPEESQPEQPQQQAEEQMPYVLDVQQPMAPSDAEAQQPQEPEPAHELRADGYHYKQAEEQLRLRH
nr:RNA polymerase II degradation factor 1 [Drosophila bipectinata]